VSEGGRNRNEKIVLVKLIIQIERKEIEIKIK
jgi:hypothetical protein